MLLLICSRHFTARRYVSAVYAVVGCLSFRPSVCLSQTGIVSKRLEESSWVFYHEGCIVRKFGYIHGYFPLELWPKLRTYKISPRQVNRVVNKTRRRWSLLTTADAPWLFIALIVRMATTLLKGEESTRDNHLLAGNFATDFEFFYWQTQQ